MAKRYRSNKKRRSRKKRRYSRKKRYVRNRQLIPTKGVRTFKYVEQSSLDPAVGGLAASYTYSCNGLYDPNISGGGHQPMGFDQLVGTMYDHYTVIGAKISVRFFSAGVAVAANTAIVGIALRDRSGYTGTLTEMLEQGRQVSRPLSTSDARGYTTVTYKVNPAKFLGRSKPLSDSQLKGTSSSNPAEQCYFIVFASSADGSSDTTPIQTTVQIEYTAVLSEPLFLAQS